MTQSPAIMRSDHPAAHNMSENFSDEMRIGENTAA